MTLLNLSRGLSAALALALAATHALAAPPLTVATWNLGWHLDHALAQRWIAECSRPFALKGERWQAVEAASESTRPGWALPWGRNAPIDWDIGTLPPCDIFQTPTSGGARAALPVTEALYAQRSARIGTLVREQLRADVIAFQEVSGAPAVRELLGSGYEVCSYEGHKVQRLAIAWKRELGQGRCEVHWPLSLPERALKDQVRPGLALTLSHAGKTLRVLTVHLKSSCVSPLDDQTRTPGRGQLDGDEPNCQQLHAQVAPLQAWVAQQREGAGALVLLGDFNRNLAHEASEPPGAAPRASNGRTRNLWRALNEGNPALTLLSPRCEGAIEGVCAIGKQRLLARDEYAQLRAELGCRNPIGLDHIVLAGAATAPSGAQKTSLGRLGDTQPAQGDQAAQLGLSDHCPVSARIAPQ